MPHRTLPVCLLALLLVYLYLLPNQSTRAAVQPCDEAGLNAAIAAGGSHTFDCAGPTTITISATKTIGLNITLDGGSLLTISGGNVRRLFYVSDSGALTLRNITLADGYAGGTGVNARGGAIYNDFGDDLVFENVTLRDNQAESGGAIYHAGVNPVTITDSAFTGNKARLDGGAFYTAGGYLTISGSSFSGNTAQQSGGAVYALGGPTTITTTTFSSNQAVWYGGAYCHACISYQGSTKILNISDSTFSGNITGSAGGALYNGEMAYIAVLGSTFANNRAGTGGAVANLNMNNDFNVANSTFSGNIAIGQGGAIANTRDTHISNVTFVGNSAPAGRGGGLYAWDWKTRVKNSLFLNNTGGDCAIDGGYTSFTGENNLSDATCTGSIGTPTHVDLALADNGGLTQTHALRYQSNAYNAVPDTKCTYLSGTYGNQLFANGDPITTDQRGLARLGTCDIGAFEYYGPVITAEPQAQTIVSGTAAILSVTAVGPGTLAYQWYQGETPDTAVPVGSNSPTHTTPALTVDTPFWVRVTNEYDSVSSYTAMIWMNVPPNISVPPASQAVTQGASAALSVTASGTPPLAYQWYAGDSGDTSRPIAGATSPTYTTPPLFTSRQYWVRVSNEEITDSAAANLTVNAPASGAPKRGYFTETTVTLSWNEINWALGYDVQLARDAAFTKPVMLIAEQPTGTLSYDATLPDNGIYYWRVRARKPGGLWSAWSAVASFIVDAP